MVLQHTISLDQTEQLDNNFIIMTLHQVNLQLAHAFDVISMTCLMFLKGYLHIF